MLASSVIDTVACYRLGLLSSLFINVVRRSWQTPLVSVSLVRRHCRPRCWPTSVVSGEDLLLCRRYLDRSPVSLSSSIRMADPRLGDTARTLHSTPTVATSSSVLTPGSATKFLSVLDLMPPLWSSSALT